MIDLLCLLLKPSLLFLSDEEKYWYLFPATFIAYWVDRLLANTSFKWMVGRGPQNGEKTISDMLENLCADASHPDHLLFTQIALKINRIDPLRRHIKAVLQFQEGN